MKHYISQLPMHARVVAAGLALLLLLLLIYIVVSLATWFIGYDRRLGDLEPRISRLQGYTLSVDDLRESTAQIEETLSAVAYPPGSGTEATGTAVQQLLRQRMEAAGFSVTGSQLLEPRDHESFDEIQVSLNVSGPIEALDDVLLDLADARPVLWVRAINLLPARVRRGSEEQVISGVLSISAVRLH